MARAARLLWGLQNGSGFVAFGEIPPANPRVPSAGAPSVALPVTGEPPCAPVRPTRRELGFAPTPAGVSAGAVGDAGPVLVPCAAAVNRNPPRSRRGPCPPRAANERLIGLRCPGRVCHRNSAGRRRRVTDPKASRLR